MESFFQALMTHAFLQNALLGGVLASVGCGIMGSYVVTKRIGFLAGGISHSALGGIGAALFFGVPPLAGALGAAIASALLIGWITLRWSQQEDTLIGAVWAAGMAVGILFIAHTPGYNVSLMSYLFGNILMVPGSELLSMAVMDLALLATTLLFFRLFLAVTFDEEFARLRGVPVVPVYLLLLCMVAVTVVLLIQVVGLILVIALLTLPAAIASQYVHSVGRMMLVASGLGVLFTVAGLAVAYQWDLPAGATIILAAAFGYLLSTFSSGVRRRYRTRDIAGLSSGGGAP